MTDSEAGAGSAGLTTSAKASVVRRSLARRRKPRGYDRLGRSRQASARRSLSSRRPSLRALRWIVAGGAIAIAVHLGMGWPTRAVAQGTGGTTFTSTFEEFFFTESPPACATIGSARSVDDAPIATTSIGPKCLGIGDRTDLATGQPNVIADPIAACGGFPPEAAPIEPTRGTLFFVAAGNINIDVYTRRNTYTCVAAVPALSRPMIVALALLTLGTGAWFLRRRTA
jgi:hypothetical protein